MKKLDIKKLADCIASSTVTAETIMTQPQVDASLAARAVSDSLSDADYNQLKQDVQFFRTQYLNAAKQDQDAATRAAILEKRSQAQNAAAKKLAPPAPAPALNVVTPVPVPAA